VKERPLRRVVNADMKIDSGPGYCGLQEKVSTSDFGAFDDDVMIQFLVEAIVLASLGGIIGITLGLDASYLGCVLMKLSFASNPMITLIAFVFSGLVGVVFGFFPAHKAARLDPIEALRHE
jgi:putative ABC transport system permease protein